MSVNSVTREEIDAITAWTVVRAAREIARRLGDALAPLQLTPVEFGALSQLAAADGLSQADLARAVGIRPQSVTPLLASLTTRGLIERRTAPGRGRHSRLGLTAQGSALLAEAWPVVAASEEWFGEDRERTRAVATALRPMLDAPASAVSRQDLGVP